MLALVESLTGCRREAAPNGPEPTPIASKAEAGLVDVPAREVTLHGEPVHLTATARLFYNLRPAEGDARKKPILVVSNGFSARIVRAFGTGPTTVADGGAVVPNAASLTRFANLLYLDPRQSGFGYDVIEGRAPTLSDCGASVFNEYVDAADMLFATLSVLRAHPELEGPVVWVGESYAGVRIQWILAFLRNRWDLAPYDDPTLRSAIAEERRTGSLLAGQILLQPWLVGRAHAEAIGETCADAGTIAAVEASVGAPCGADACSCADAHGRSRYDFAFTLEEQNRREYEAALAHVDLAKAELLFGVPLDAVARLGGAERARGFKCDVADESTPPDDALVARFGALPKGQSYFLPFNPLQPGKELEHAQADWYAETFVGRAFVDNLADVPAFVTDGALDLVVPERALVPALSKVIGTDHVAMESASRIRVEGPAGSRFIDVGAYPGAGHMVTMLAADDLSRDVAKWLGDHGFQI